MKNVKTVKQPKHILHSTDTRHKALDSQLSNDICTSNADSSNDINSQDFFNEYVIVLGKLNLIKGKIC